MNSILRRAVYIGMLGALSASVSTSADDLQSNSRSNGEAGCSALPSYSQLKEALTVARNQGNGGFNLDMWGTVVNRDGIVCAVAFTGDDRGSQWPGSRVISAQKANTANSFSLPALALSTANLYAAVQPGGSLYGLQHSNPVETLAAYQGPASRFGRSNDPMVGSRIGGVNVFGGGLALYNSKQQLVGAVGVSGDTSCADHNVAWRMREALGLNKVPAGVNPNRKDAIVFDLGVDGKSASGFGHVKCAGDEADIADELAAGVGGRSLK